MKRVLVFIFISRLAVYCWGQMSIISDPISVRIEKNVKPAILELVPGSVRFEDAGGNNAIDANEQCYIKLSVANSGVADAVGCKTKISVSGQSKSITIPNVSLPTIPAGKQHTVTIPITAGKDVQNGQVLIYVEITEPHGFGTDPTELTLVTRELPKPYLKIVDYAVTSSQGSTILHKKTPFDLQLLLQNVKNGDARDVHVTIHLPEGVYLMDGEMHSTFAQLNGGEAKSLNYSLIVTNNYASNQIPIQVSVSEQYGTCAENKTVELQINQALSSNKMEIQALATSGDEIQVAQIGSIVDKNIPKTDVINKNTFALIIANESYLQVAPVPYALNDGIVFQKYCTNTLGIPDANIFYLPNGTSGQIRALIERLRKITDAFPSAKIIVYYAGHGIPDERNQTAYLLPIDGASNDWTTGIKLDDLYATLGALPAQSVTVFLDACFSGSIRSGKMLTSARGVAIKTRPGMPQGNMVVFAAAQGDETAYQNNKEGHGMFTYFLLKKLQESKGDVTLQELGDYIITNVKQQSILLNGKSQTPCVTATPNLQGWQKWKLQ